LSTATQQRGSAGQNTGRGLITRFAVALAIIIAVLLVISAVVMASAGHDGEQISIDGFQRRRFSYYESMGFRLSATDYFDITGNFEQTLVTRDWIEKNKAVPTDQDWVTVTHSTANSTYQSDAHILVNYLEMAGSRGPTDVAAWSDANPGYAAVMWREIQIAGHGNMFILIPDLIHFTMDVAANSNPDWATTIDDVEMTKEKEEKTEPTQKEKDALEKQHSEHAKQVLEPYLIEKYFDSGKAAVEAEDWTRARFCYQQVLRLQPDHEKAADLLRDVPQLADSVPSGADVSTTNN